MSIKIGHPYHLVGPSHWPLFFSIAALGMTTGLIEIVFLGDCYLAILSLLLVTTISICVIKSNSYNKSRSKNTKFTADYFFLLGISIFIYSVFIIQLIVIFINNNETLINSNRVFIYYYTIALIFIIIFIRSIIIVVRLFYLDYPSFYKFLIVISIFLSNYEMMLCFEFIIFWIHIIINSLNNIFIILQNCAFNNTNISHKYTLAENREIFQFIKIIQSSVNIKLSQPLLLKWGPVYKSYFNNYCLLDVCKYDKWIYAENSLHFLINTNTNLRVSQINELNTLLEKVQAQITKKYGKII